MTGDILLGVIYIAFIGLGIPDSLFLAFLVGEFAVLVNRWFLF